MESASATEGCLERARDQAPQGCCKGMGSMGQRSSTAKPLCLGYPSQPPKSTPVLLLPPPQPHGLKNNTLNPFSELSPMEAWGKSPAGTQGLL